MNTAGSINFSKDDILFSNTICFYFVFIAGNYTLKTIFGNIGTVNSIYYLSLAILLFIIMKSLRNLINKHGRIVVNSFALFLSLFVISIISNSIENRPIDLIIKDVVLWNIGLWIPLGCCVYAIEDKHVLYDRLIKSSYIIDIFLFFSFVFRRTTTESGLASYDMTFGISLTLAIIIHLSLFIRSRKTLILIMIILEMAALLLYGNRGVLLSVLFYLLYKTVFEGKNKLLATTVVLSIVAFVMFSDTILLSLSDFLLSHNIQSRSLSMLANNTLAESSERDDLRLISMQLISEKPILGWGLGGEFYEIAKRYAGATTDVTSSFNPHNGILQNLVEFGMIGGTIASLSCVYPLLKLRAIKDDITKELLLVFGSYSIITRVVSAAGFFTHPEVAVFLYLFYSERKKKKSI